MDRSKLKERVDVMSPKERAIAALELREPSDIVPTFELEFQLTEELLGKKDVADLELKNATGKERKRLLERHAELMIEVAEKLDYSILRQRWFPSGITFEETIHVIRFFKIHGDKYLIMGNTHGTYGIPDGAHLLDPTAGVDIGEVKKLAGDKICLIGNVDCTLLEKGKSFC